jgi:cyclophilin family peptidyl-prolyl cis-trans isomerase
LSKHIYLSLLIIAVILGGVLFFSRGEETEVEDSFEANEAEEMIATIQTNFGEIKLEFFGDKAPKTVENFLKLAKGGFYDGTKFHRVISGFMIQGGDPLSADDSKKDSWGTGGPGYTFADEIYEGNSNALGTISMANAGPNTNGSQFFINTADNNFLDSKHTVFGRVVDGVEVVRGIESAPTGGLDRPLQDVVIKSVTVK